MKFYISAKWQLKDDVEKMRDYLIEHGHELTADWTVRVLTGQ